MLLVFTIKIRCTGTTKQHAWHNQNNITGNPSFIVGEKHGACFVPVRKKFSFQKQKHARCIIMYRWALPRSMGSVTRCAEARSMGQGNWASCQVGCAAACLGLRLLQLGPGRGPSRTCPWSQCLPCAQRTSRSALAATVIQPISRTKRPNASSDSTGTAQSVPLPRTPFRVSRAVAASASTSRSARNSPSTRQTQPQKKTTGPGVLSRGKRLPAAQNIYCDNRHTGCAAKVRAAVKPRTFIV